MLEPVPKNWKKYAADSPLKDLESPPQKWTTPGYKKQKNYDGKICVDLFAGCGGASLGMIQAGFRVPIAVEMDPWCFLTYASNLGMDPDNPIVFFRKDIRKISGVNIVKSLQKLGYSGIVDCLWMSPPCQGFSTANPKSIDERCGFTYGSNYCMLESLRLLEEIRPAMFGFENVTGLCRGKMLPLWEEWQRRVKSIGYNFSWEILNAADYGVPQNRKRIIGVGEDVQVIHAIDEVCYPLVPLN